MSVSVDASDDKSVAKVEVSVDGTLVTTLTAAPYTYSWDTTTYTNATHTISAKAYDSINQTASSSVTVTVSNTINPPPTDSPPTISIIAPTQGATVNATVAISSNATDDNSVAKVEVSIDGTLVASPTVAPYTYMWDTTASTNATHTISAKAYDSIGQTALASLTVTVFNNTPQPPTSAGLKGFYSVTDYGAKGDGTTDDTAAIASAVAAASNAGGGIIYFPPGTYLVSSSGGQAGIWLENKHGLILEGAGKSSTIKLGAGLGAFARGLTLKHSDNITIRDLAFDGNKVNNVKNEQQHGIFNWASTNIIIERVWARYWWGDAIYAAYEDTTGPASNVWVKDCQVYASGRMGIDMTGGKEIYILDNETYDDGGAFAIKIEQETATLKNITISGNVVHGSYLGIILKSTTTTNAHDLVISGNQLLGTKSAWGAIFASLLTGGVISGNMIDGAQNAGIQLSNSKNTSVTGNTIIHSTQGINEDSTSGSNLFVGNITRGNTQGNVESTSSTWTGNLE